MTPFDKVKNQLIVKIKEIYVPDPSSLGGVINKFSQLDFTGGSESENTKNKEKTEKSKPKKQNAPDFT